MTTTYEAVAHREGHWWVFRLPALTSPGPDGKKTITAMGQARRARDIAAEAGDVASMWTDQPSEAITVNVRFELPATVAGAVEEASRLDREGRSALARAAALRRESAMALRRDGLSQTDIAAVLGLSRQRIGQLTA
jgi:DNA-directed RNA polymerase specialized sigma24 family protein